MLPGESPPLGGIGGAEGAVAVGLKTHGHGGAKLHVVIDDQDGLEAGGLVG